MSFDRDERPELQILIACEDDAQGPIVVDAGLVRVFSSCAGAMPEGAATWDISNLIIDGQPVQHSTVIRWLNICYTAIHDRPFDERSVYRQPAVTVTEVYQLLAFADAVGSTKAVLKACVPDLNKLRVQATVGSQAVQLMLCDSPSWFEMVRCGGGLKALHQGLSFTHHASKVGKQWALPSTAQAASAEVAAQVEQLLFIAHKLQLPLLLQRVQAFITAAATAPMKTDMLSDLVPLLPLSLLSPAVYSPRVCGVAGYTQQQADTAWASRQHQLCLLGANSRNRSPFLRHFGPEPAALEFNARMQGQGFAGIACDGLVDVVVKIADGRPVVRITSTTSSSGTSTGGQQVSYTFPAKIIADNDA